MHFSLPLLAVLCSSITTTLSSVVPTTKQLLDRSPVSHGRANSGWERRNGTGSCTPENVLVRKEWRTLSNEERKRYTDAVLCLKKIPSIYPEVEGAKARFDDFQIVHINMTRLVHFDAAFLGWHRWFVWTYDQAMRHECGYKGFQPYWDWTLDASDIVASPLFDGSPYSMSGDGEFIPNRTTFYDTISLPSIGSVKIPNTPGNGGGCVTTGPFANFTVQFGEVGGSINTSSLDNPKNLAHTPHCLRRDLNPGVVNVSLTAANVETLLESPNITVFNNVLELGTDPMVQSLHAGGHFGVGRDMRDTFSSPGDPIFYLHHAQLDRLWTKWQILNLTDRQYAISETGTFLNYPVTPTFQLNDTITLLKLSPGGPQPIRDFLNTLGGPFCYEYAA